MRENAQTIRLRVYYEDTDFSGRVYHASFLRFFERGRTEWLRALGYRHNAVAEANQTTFAVTKLAVQYAAAASIDDLLEVVTVLHRVKGPVLTFKQSAARDDVILASGEVDIVAIKANRAVRPPREILAALAPDVPHESRQVQRTPEIP
jgi:acyl-CoA thioester hydrolase